MNQTDQSMSSGFELEERILPSTKQLHSRYTVQARSDQKREGMVVAVAHIAVMIEESADVGQFIARG